MTPLEITLTLTAAANAAAAVLAWLAKLRWSKEYQDATNRIIQAKDAIIDAKDTEIAVLQRYTDTLQQLNPKEVAEWYEGMKTVFKEYTDSLHSQLTTANQRIESLEAGGKQKDDDVRKSKEAHQQLSSYVFQMEAALSQHRLPDFKTVVSSGTSSRALDESTAGAAPAVKFDFIRELNELAKKQCK